MGWNGKINIGNVDGVNQGTTDWQTPADERIRELEEKVEKLLNIVSK